MIICQINPGDWYDWDIVDLKDQESWVIASNLKITNDGKYGYITYKDSKEKLLLLDDTSIYPKIDKLNTYTIRQDKHSSKYLRMNIIDLNEMNEGYIFFIYYNT